MNINNIIAFFKNFSLIVALIISGISGVLGLAENPNVPPDSNYPLSAPLEISQKNLQWEEDQIFPTFAEPDGELIAFQIICFPAFPQTSSVILQSLPRRLKSRYLLR